MNMAKNKVTSLTRLIMYLKPIKVKCRYDYLVIYVTCGLIAVFRWAPIAHVSLIVAV